MKLHYTEQESLEGTYEPRLLTYLFVLYIALSFFEAYLSRFIGAFTRYYLLILIGLYLYGMDFKVKINYLSKSMLIWFALKFCSLLWSNHSNMAIVNANMFSQIGMALFIFSVTARGKNEQFLKTAIQASLWCSFSFGILSIVFRGTYIDERFVARQVLTLWGQQNDPNNCCAFLGIGIGIAAYSVFCESYMKLWMKLVNFAVIIVNSYAIVLTGSRGGFLLLGALLIISGFLPNWNRSFKLQDAFKKIVLVALILIAAIYVIDRFMPEASLARVIAFNEYQGGSGRIDKWKIALELIASRPILGQGWGGYVIMNYSAIHNTFLTIWCDTGFVGLVIFIVPVIYMLIKGIKEKSLLSTVILLTGIIPAISIDSINKRYFWNAIILSYLLLEYVNANGSHILIWDNSTVK